MGNREESLRKNPGIGEFAGGLELMEVIKRMFEAGMLTLVFRKECSLMALNLLGDDIR